MSAIAWPEDLGYGTVVGRFAWLDADDHDLDRLPQISAVNGATVLIAPSVGVLRYTGAAGPMTLPARQVEGVIDAEGYLCTPDNAGIPGDRGIVLPATDSLTVSPTGFTYAVTVNIPGVTIPRFNISLATGETKDLATAVPVPATGGNAVVIDTSTADRAVTAANEAETAANEAETHLADMETLIASSGVSMTPVTDHGDGTYTIGA